MSVYDLKNKVAIVTGAGSGIGYKVAELLLQEGCIVVFSDLSLQPAAESTITEYATSTDDKLPRAVFHKTNVVDWSQLHDLWDTALKKFGQIDIVANIAGVYEPPFTDFWKPPVRDAPDANPGCYPTISVNYIAPVRLAQLAVNYWCQNLHIQGNFLAVSSIVAFMHSALTPLYMSTKAALVSFVKSLGHLHEHFGIRVAAVCPSMVVTPMMNALLNEESQEEGSLTPQECAGVILRVLQEAQWGRGSIVATQKIVAENLCDEVSVTEVDLGIVCPPLQLPERVVERLGEDKELLIARLKAKGM